MKIVFREDSIRFYTNGILEQLYLERLGLRHKGDIAKCVVVSYEGSYTILELLKVTERKTKDGVGLYEWPEEDRGIDVLDKGKSGERRSEEKR